MAEKRTEEYFEARQKAAQEKKRKYQIFDVDGHLVETDAEIRPYMEEPYCHRKGPLLGTDAWHTGRGRREGAPNSMEERLRVMTEEGVALSLLFPSRAMDIGTIAQKDYVRAFCRAYNTYASKECRDPRLKAAAVIPLQDVSFAVEEIERTVNKLKLSAVVISSFGLYEHLGSQAYWPIYDVMERLNIPLMVHCSIQGPTGDRRATSRAMQHTFGRPVATMTDCAALIYGGVPEKFPKLRVGFLENRAAWVPYWMDVLDAKWAKRRSDAPLLKAKPSEYMKAGSFFYAPEPDEKALPYVIDKIGDDLLVFASDYPHSGSTFTADLLERDDISEQTMRKMIEDNGKRLLFGSN